MAYDCTLHLVDPKRIRRVMVEKLLGRTDVPTPFDDNPDAPLVWRQVRTALQGDDPAHAASLVCQLAVMWSSAELPNRCAGDGAFSLWDLEGVRAPDAITASPEPIFTELVERYPALSGHFPTQFSGPYSTGVYLPPDRVPFARAWLRDQLTRCSPHFAARYEAMSFVLQVAKQCGFGFWEATDLAVDEVHPEWLLPQPQAPRRRRATTGRRMKVQREITASDQTDTTSTRESSM